jgi:predicted RNA-binding Zn ribbon-like protein
MRKRADPFEWSGGDPALDLVNTLDERPFDAPIENLVTYRDLVHFVQLAGLIEAPLAATLRSRTGSACTRIVTRTRELREHLHEVLAAAHGGQPAPRRNLDTIGAAIRAAHGAQHLVGFSSRTLASRRWATTSRIDIPLHACALAIERLLADVDRSRIRKCGAGDCDVYFIDTSKARRRRWCSMKNCGNREKQRRWRSL